MWGDELSEHVLELGYKKVEGWPSVYAKTLDSDGIPIIIAYVDDLLFLGTKGPKGHQREIAKLRLRVKMDDPDVLSKYLGCHHSFSKKTVEGNVVTESQYDMADYMRQACEVYTEKTGLSLKAADSPFAPELPDAQLQELLAKPGRYQQHSASVLMKLLYAARMAAPWLSVAIQRLARQIHRWTAECDRRLHRLYCYVHSTLEQVLKGCLSTDDLAEIRIDFWADADLAGDLFSTKSTSGRYVELTGKQGRSMPLHWGPSNNPAPNGTLKVPKRCRLRPDFPKTDCHCSSWSIRSCVSQSQ
jgi:hypothetical protein